MLQEKGGMVIKYIALILYGASINNSLNIDE